MYYSLTIKDNTYKCVLSAEACCDLEDKLKTNPLNLFSQLDDGILPKLSDLISIFHASLQKYQHGIDRKKACEIYDSFIEDGGNMLEFSKVIFGIFKESGFVANNTEEEEESKN